MNRKSAGAVRIGICPGADGVPKQTSGHSPGASVQIRPVWAIPIWALAGCLWALAPDVLAVQKPAAELPNFDRRATQAPLTTPRPAKTAAVSALGRRVSGVRVDFDANLKTPRFIAATDGFLTGPNGTGRGTTAATAAGFPLHDPHRPLKAFLKEHQQLFGHGPEILAAAKVTREVATPHNGLKTVVWQQQVDGIPVFEGVLIAHTTRQGELVNLSSRFLPDPDQAASRGSSRRKQHQTAPSVIAPQAVALAARNVGDPVEAAEVLPLAAAPAGAEQRQQFKADRLKGPADARLVWLPMAGEQLRLCWQVILTSRSRNEMFRLLVDAETGDVLVRHCLTKYLSDATYRVFTSDGPSPFSPGHPMPLTNQPPLVPRSLVTLAALSTNASPLGWIDDGANETRGNNVDAHLDQDGDDEADLPRPQGQPFRVFDFPLDLGREPRSYGSAAVVQLFYWCNWMHDTLYELGFTEAAGNFQNDNFGRGGLDGDALQADAQDGSGTDNANISVPPDGLAPRMQMFGWTGPQPWRDSDLDTGIVLHEYTHGLSERMVGGGVGLSAWQSGGLGEGWSDFYGLALLSEAGDDLDGCYPASGYSCYLLYDLAENYYFGIRRYPYSTDLAKNPLTFKDIDPLQASPHPGVPLSPLFTPFAIYDANEVHNQGEVWCVMLWEARANLVRKHGFAAGNPLSLQLVTDGMRLAPANPNFLQARDAILQADLVNNGGANLRELWAAFAKRGLGFSATSPESWETAGVREAFDLPGDLIVTPSLDSVAAGPVGGPFTPAAQTYLLMNIGATPLAWTAGAAVPWLTVAPGGGELAPDGPTAQVTVTLDAVAGLLPDGTYTNTVWFTNVNRGTVESRQFVLSVGQPDYFTEWFQIGDNDLAFQRFTFTPDGSPTFYSVCREPATELTVDPLGGRELWVGDEGRQQVRLSGTNTVALYDLRTNLFAVSDNGYLAIGGGGEGWTESPEIHFARPRISALFDDFDPEESGGSISVRELDDRVAVTYLGMGEFGEDNQSTFQVEWFFDGRIRLTYLRLETQDGLVGLSRGEGMPAGFVESDFTRYAPCATSLALGLPESASENDGVLAGQGMVSVATPPATDLVVQLTSRDPARITVPASVTIPAGATNAVFDLTLLDNAVLGGPQRSIITAEAPSYGAAGGSLLVLDNESATLQLNVPATAAEGDAALRGALTLSAPCNSTLIVHLSSSAPAQVRVPPFLFVAAGQTSAVFDVTIVDDLVFDGDQGVTLTAQVPNWPVAAATLVVRDNETPGLELVLPAESIEGQQVRVNAGVIRLSGIVPADLVVALASSDISELTVPPAVTVPAGQSNVLFDLTVVDDEEPDGPQTVTVTASATGFPDAARTTIVLDNLSPPVPMPAQPDPPHQATQLSLNADLSWGTTPWEVLINGGFEQGDFAGWSTKNSGSAMLQLHQQRLEPLAWDQPNHPFAGRYCALAEVPARGGQAVLCQQFTLPAWAAGPVLRWAEWVWIDDSDWGGYSFEVEIRDPEDRLLERAPVSSLRPSWTKRTFNLSGYIGQTIRIAFVVADDSGPFKVYLDDVSVALSLPDFLPSEVFFGTNAIPVPADYAGATTEARLALPPLEPLTTYYWQVVPQSEPQRAGPVWQFTTRGVEHFDWSAVASPQYVGQPFSVMLTARDERGRAMTNFTGSVDLAGPVDTSVVLFRDNFEDGDCAGWEPDPENTGSAVTTLTAARGDYSFALSGGQFTAGQTGVIHLLPELRPSRVSFFVRASETTAYGGNFSLMDGSYVAVTFCLAASGTMGLYSSGGWGWHAVPYEANRWYKTTLAFDWEAREIDYYVDGQLMILGIPFGSDHLDVEHFSSLRLMNEDNTVCWFDEIEFASGPTPRSVAVSPGRVGPFIDGVWAGEIAVQAPAEHMILVADDGYGHTGASGVLNVLPWNDVSLTMTTSSEVAGLGELVEFNLVVTNWGPATASGIVVTSTWPGHVEFAGARASQGTFQEMGNSVVFTVGTLTGGTAASLGLTLLPRAAYAFPNLAVLTHNEAECCPENNTAMAAVSVQPDVGISDVAIREGNAGATNAVFLVTLSGPTDRPVTIGYTVSSGMAEAGFDFAAPPGPLVIAPGATSAPLTVPIFGDVAVESDETFLVRLEWSDYAFPVVYEAVGTILNDDGAPGEIARLEWSPIASSQQVNEPIAVTLTARDAAGGVATNFNGSVGLAARAEAAEFRMLGHPSGIESGFPIYTGTCDQRSQAIYPPWDLGGPGRIVSLALDVTRLPGQTLSNWTIRVKHTDLDCFGCVSYEGRSGEPLWEWADWTVVCQTNWTITATGWVTCAFTTPFDYNGSDSLLVDFSFSNDSVGASNGMCSAAQYGVNRAMVFSTCDDFGNPLAWTGSTPPPVPFTITPNLRLGFAAPTPVPIWPPVTGNFSNGLWTGTVLVQAPATNLALCAADFDGHTGVSGNFDVLAANDLALSMSAAPETVRAGEELTFTLVVTNAGPLDSTGVMVTNPLPEFARFLSASNAQGGFALANGQVVLDVGAVNAGAAATLSLTVVPLSAGTLTNHAVVTRREPENYLLNNAAGIGVTVKPPCLLLDDLAVTEGDQGPTNIAISVRLSAPCVQPMRVFYSVYGSTAQEYEDFLVPDGEFTFPPGVTETNLIARVQGDAIFEADETFQIWMYSRDADCTPAATITILNDDPLPALSITDVTVREGDDGTTNAVFTVRLSAPAGTPIEVDYYTTDGTALAGSDYLPQARTLEFPPGTTRREISIAVPGDSLPEADETFFVRLRPVTNAVLADAEGAGTILNDDGAPGELAWIEWSPVASPQYAGWPFAVTLTARDMAGNSVTNFSGPVALSGVQQDSWMTIIGTESAWTCLPFGCTDHDLRAQVIYLAEEIGDAGRILDLALEVTHLPGCVLSNWTVRMKHTPRRAFVEDLQWESDDWTIVFQTNLDLATPGWLWIPLTTAFDYNGMDNLMVDFSFNETGDYANGYCRGTSQDAQRVLFHFTDTDEGDPLAWSGLSPAHETSTTRPNLRLGMSRQTTFAVQPGETDGFVNGLWSGDLAISQTGANLHLIATTPDGRSSASLPLMVESSADADADTLPDTWEVRCFGATNAPGGGPNDDPDADGATNGQEFLAGTDPLDAGSSLRIVSVQLLGPDILLQFATVAGKRYQVEGTDDLTRPSWSPVAEPILGTGGMIPRNVSGVFEQPIRFYRVRLGR